MMGTIPCQQCLLQLLYDRFAEGVRFFHAARSFPKIFIHASIIRKKHRKGKHGTSF